MTACLFIGPTLAADDVGPGFHCLPPAAQGDVVRAIRRHAPDAVGIVDGLFGGAPAVWHKEILWALDQGVAVFGSASMGALRAADLHGFGMRGVGRIFEAYRDGVIEDDDEVALIHGPAALGYPALSEPMVNIRATLARAEREGVLDSHARAALTACAKSRHFPERTWPGVLDGCAGLLDAAARARFTAWLAMHRVDQKRSDALEMIEAMRDAVPVLATPFPFAVTHHWNALLARIDREADSLDEAAQRVLEELRLGPQEHLRAVEARALLRRSVLGAGVDATSPALDAAHAGVILRAELGLVSRDRFHAWLGSNNLDPGGFEALALRSQQVRAFRGRAGGCIASDLVDELRSSGQYPGLAARAAAKTAVLAQEGGADRLCPEARLGLRQWFATRRLGNPGAALPTLLVLTGFETADALDQALHREHLYLTLTAPAPKG